MLSYTSLLSTGAASLLLKVRTLPNVRLLSLHAHSFMSTVKEPAICLQAAISEYVVKRLVRRKLKEKPG